jgi:hypothetical protein
MEPCLMTAYLAYALYWFRAILDMDLKKIWKIYNFANQTNN